MVIFLRFIVAGVAGIILAVGTLTTIAASAQENMSERIVCSGVSNPAGVAVDNRCNIYTVDKKTGSVFCISPSTNPVLLGTVPGIPTSLAVNSARTIFIGTENGQIFLLTLDGTLAKAYRCHSAPTGLDVDRDGGLIVAMRTGEIITIRRSDFTLE